MATKNWRHLTDKINAARDSRPVWDGEEFLARALEEIRKEHKETFKYYEKDKLRGLLLSNYGHVSGPAIMFRCDNGSITTIWCRQADENGPGKDREEKTSTVRDRFTRGTLDMELEMFLDWAATEESRAD